MFGNYFKVYVAGGSCTKANIPAVADSKLELYPFVKYTLIGSDLIARVI